MEMVCFYSADQLFFYQPSFYSKFLPDKMKSVYAKLAKVLKGQSQRKAPFASTKTLTSFGGHKFISFAKHKKWKNGNLYCVVVVWGILYYWCIILFD